MSTSQINWQKFLEGQSKLDKYIFEKKGLNYEFTSKHRLLSLFVELGELINESKVFKFWSNKSWDRDKTLEEYVDVFHFLLSFLLEKSVVPENISLKESKLKNPKELMDSFLDLINSTSDLTNLKNMNIWIQKFIDLGSDLGFSWSEIDSAYWRKNEINIKRQDQGY